jgi:hypothetical protein
MAKAALPVRWAPPALKPGYTVVDLSKTGTKTYFEFKPDEDVLILGATTPRTLNHLQTKGGNNIVLVGGKYEPVGGDDSSKATLKFTHVNGQVWVEGVHIDHKNLGARDALSAFSANGKQADFVIQNSRIENVTGKVDGVHGDVFQPHGNIGDVRFYNVTGKSDYQGLLLYNRPDLDRAMKSVTLEKVEMEAVAPGDASYSWMYFFERSSGGSSYPVSLKDVYVVPRAGQYAGSHDVMPTVGGGAVLSNGEITFPKQLTWTGSIKVGNPASGDMVTADKVGLGYVRDLKAPLLSEPSPIPTPAPDPVPTSTPATSKIMVTASADYYLANPIMEIRADGAAIAKHTVTADHSKGAWQTFTASTDLSQADDIAVVFLNDKGARDLWIKDVKIDADSDGDIDVTFLPRDADYIRPGASTITGKSEMSWAGELQWDVSTDLHPLIGVAAS